MKSTIFQGFWHGPPLGPLREACLNSFIELGHKFELYTYEQFSVPKGVILRNATEIIPYNEIFYYDNPNTNTKDLGPFSDLFRFKLLYERGGWWSDVDTICLNEKIPSVKRAWAQELPEKRNNAIGTSQIAMQAGDPLIFELYIKCLELSKTKFHPREALGPHLISSIINDHGLPRNMFGSPKTFYPIRWIEMFKLWIPEYKDEINFRAKKALFMPIYQSFPQYIGLELNKLPPTGSYLDGIFHDYLNRYNTTEKYLSQDIENGTIAFFKNNENWAIPELRSVCGDVILNKLNLSK